MATLALTYRPLTALRNGYDVRVAHLCRATPGDVHLVTVPLVAVAETEHDLDCTAAFATATELPEPVNGAPAWRRHLRRDENEYYHLAFPVELRETIARLRDVASATGADRMMIFGAQLAPFARGVGIDRTILDICDSTSLRLRRQHAAGIRADSMAQRVADRLDQARWARAEGRIPHLFGQVTTVNDADTREIRALAGRDTGNVHTVPIGVGERFLRDAAVGPLKRGVAFWGNLEFPPNREGARFLIESVYEPFLRRRGVEVCVVGAEAEPWLQRAARSDPQIRLLGYVPDIVEAVGAYPVMVNPMLLGGGMKSKVLEAFGLGLAVVSTAMGIEAIPDAVPGEHYLLADDPAGFAETVLRLLDHPDERQGLVDNARRLVLARYRWSAVGARWRAILERI